MKKIALVVIINFLMLGSLYAETLSKSNSTVYINSSFQDAGIVNQLVSTLSDQLTQNKDFEDIKLPTIAITSFVCLETFKATSRLSNIISENLIHEMQVRGYKVIDFKMMDNIKIDSRGDFLFSRDISKLRKSLNIDYALTGTYTEYKSGTVVNARIVNLKTHVVLSTAQIFIHKKTLKRISASKNKIVDFTPHRVSLSK